MADNAGLHGLSAPGVYLAADVTTDTGGLLPHPFTLTLLLATSQGHGSQPGGLLSVALAVSASRPILPVR